MNQPNGQYPNNGQQPQYPSQPQYPAQSPYQGQPPYGQPGYGAQHGAQPYGPSGGFSGPSGPDNKKSNKLPAIIAAVAVVAIAVAVTLFFVLRDDDEKTAVEDGDGDTQTVSVAAEDAEAVVQAFITAVDEQDEQTLESVTAGELTAQIDNIVANGKDLNLPSGDYYQDTETAEVEDGHVAIVYWALEVNAENGVLAGLLFADKDSGEGFKVCDIDDQFIDDVDQLTSMEEWKDDYQSTCAASSSGGGGGGEDTAKPTAALD